MPGPVQAKSNKQDLSELEFDLAPETRNAFYQDGAKRRTAAKVEIKALAKQLDAGSVASDANSAPPEP
jgi:hypothetical protein